MIDFLTQTSRFTFPSAVSQTRDLFYSLTGRESKSRIALVHGLAVICYIGGTDGETIVNLWYRSTVDFLAFGDVCGRPVTTGHTLSGDASFTSGEFLSSWTCEGNNSSKGSVST